MFKRSDTYSFIELILTCVLIIIVFSCTDDKVRYVVINQEGTEVFDEYKSEKVRIGVGIANLDDKNAMTCNYESIKGVIITHVTKDSPAKISGISVGDIIISINKYKTANIEQFLELIKGYDHSNSIKITIIRKCVIKVVNVTFK